MQIMFSQKHSIQGFWNAAKVSGGIYISPCTLLLKIGIYLNINIKFGKNIEFASVFILFVGFVQKVLIPKIY